jgi:hypothetical protein
LLYPRQKSSKRSIDSRVGIFATFAGDAGMGGNKLRNPTAVKEIISSSTIISTEDITIKYKYGPPINGQS